MLEPAAVIIAIEAPWMNVRRAIMSSSRRFLDFGRGYRTWPGIRKHPLRRCSNAGQASLVSPPPAVSA